MDISRNGLVSHEEFMRGFKNAHREIFSVEEKIKEQAGGAMDCSIM
jgi:hypothetical protein